MPVPENCHNKTGSFLCQYPLHGFTQETNVPILMGMTSGEGGIFVARRCLFISCFNTAILIIDVTIGYVIEL